MPSIAETWVSVMAETSKVAPQIREAFDRAEQGLGKVKVEADTTKAKEEIDKVTKDRKTTVKAEADTTKANAEIDKAAKDRKVHINVDVDRNQLNRALQGFGDDVSRITQGNGGLLKIAASVDSSKLGSELDNFVSSLSPGVSKGIESGGQAGISALSPALMGVGITMAAGIAAALSGLSALIPAGLLGAGGVVGTLALGLDGVKTAYDAVSKASESSGKDQAAQAREVTSAERGLTDAVQSQSQAQKDVANAYRDSRNQLDDLNLSLKGGQISEAQAYNDVLKARRDLARGGFKDQLDLNDANLRVQESEQRWQESRQHGIELQQKASDANAKGVAGSDLVVAAKEKERRANETVAAAQDTLSVATNKTADAAQSAIQAMAKLSPNAAAFVNTLQGLKPAFEGLKNSVQDALFANLGTQFQQLATTYLPLLKSFFTSFASTINQSFGQIAGILESPQMLKTMQSVFTNLADSFRNFAPAIGPMVDGFMKLSQVGSTFLPALGTAFTNAAQGFSQFITQATQSGQLQTWIQTGITALGQLSDIMRMLTSAFFNLAPIGSAVLGMLQQVLPTLLPAVGPLAKAFSDWLTALSPLLEIIGKLVGGLLVTFAGMVTDLNTAVSRGLDDYGKYVEFFVKLYGGIGDLVGEGPAVQQFFSTFKSSAEDLLDPLQAIEDAVDAIKDAYSLITTGHLPSKFTPFSASTQASTSIFGGTPPPAPPGAPPSFIGGGGSAGHLADWDKIVGAEASGNWQIHSGNGFYGGLQFTPDSWKAAGGLQYASSAELATPDQQKTVADKLLQMQGPGAWPATSAAHPDWFKPATSTGVGGLAGAGLGVPSSPAPSALPANITIPGNLPDAHGAHPQIALLTSLANQFGLQLTSGKNDHGVDQGYHPLGEAGDFSNGDKTPQETAFANFLAQNFQPYIAELIHDAPGYTGNIKDGKNTGAFGNVYTMGQAGYHGDHDHVAITDAMAPAFEQAVAQLFPGGVTGQGGIPSSTYAPTMASGPTGTLNDPMNVSLPNSQVTQMSSAAQQLGQGLLGGILQEFGIDGSVLKDPTQFGAFKFLKSGMGILTKPSSGSPGSSGTSGTSILDGLIQGMTGVKPTQQFMPNPPNQALGPFGPPTPGPPPGPVIQGDYMPINVSPNVDPKAILTPVQQQQNSYNASLPVTVGPSR